MGVFQDLTGQQFGEWKVISYRGKSMWECECSCGKLKDVHSYSLRNGKSVSCGHNTTGFKDLSGQKINEWNVIEYIGNGYYKCVCSCGKEKNVLANSLLQNKSTSCGHDSNSFIDLTGKTFSELTVIEYIGDGMWRCKCSCGKIISVHTYALRSGNTRSCGCKKREIAIQTKIQNHKEISSSKENKREMWQIETINDKHKLKGYLESFKIKPSYIELTKLLGVNYSTISQRVRKFDLEKYIAIEELVSYKEKELREVIGKITQDELIFNSREIVKGLELDIYIPAQRIALEFNGDYWHSDKCKESNYHRLKSMECARNNIRLIHIYEFEWDNASMREKLIAYIKYMLCKNNRVKINDINKDEKFISIGYTDIEDIKIYYKEYNDKIKLIQNDELIMSYITDEIVYALYNNYKKPVEIMYSMDKPSNIDFGKFSILGMSELDYVMINSNDKEYMYQKEMELKNISEEEADNILGMHNKVYRAGYITLLYSN